MLNMSRSISSLGLQVGEAKAPDSKKCKAEVNPKVEEAASDGSVGDRVQKQGKGKNSSKPAAEPPKDYVHVRARRGQATDSHSLAERVLLLHFTLVLVLIFLLLLHEWFLACSFCIFSPGL
jgi:hypothetical protein